MQIRAREWKRWGRALAAFAVANAATFAMANLSDVVFKIQASSPAGTGVYELTQSDLGWHPGADHWAFNGKDSVTISDPNSNTPIAVLNHVNLFFRSDPQINLSFSVQAGSADTTFTITSSLLSFPNIVNAQGQASAGFTVTDTGNNGATLTGANVIGGGNPDVAYVAYENGLPGAGTLFSGLVQGVSVPAGSQSASTAENDPPAGFRSAGTNINSMSAQISFTLSANDLASGTTSYEIVPEPSALVLLGLGAATLLRRKA